MLLVIVNFVLNCLDNTSWWDILLVLYISSMFIYLLAFVELPSLASLYCYWYWVVCYACADCLLILCYWVVRTCIIELFLVLVLVSWPFAGHYFAPCSVILLTFEFLMLLCITLTQKNLKLRNFLALALVCTPFMLVVIDFFQQY